MPRPYPEGIPRVYTPGVYRLVLLVQDRAANWHGAVHGPATSTVCTGLT